MGSALGSITRGGGCGRRDGDGCAGRGDEGANGGYATPRRSRTNLRRPRRTLRQVASWSSGVPTNSFKAPTHSFRTSLAFLNTAREEDAAAAGAAFKAAATRRKSSSAAVTAKGKGKGRKGQNFNFGAMGRWTASNGASPHCAGAAAHSANGQCLCSHDDGDSDSDSDGLHKPDKHGPARLSWSGNRIGFKPMRRVTYANSPTNAA